VSRNFNAPTSNSTVCLITSRFTCYASEAYNQQQPRSRIVLAQLLFRRLYSKTSLQPVYPSGSFNPVRQVGSHTMFSTLSPLSNLWASCVSISIIPLSLSYMMAMRTFATNTTPFIVLRNHCPCLRIHFDKNHHRIPSQLQAMQHDPIVSTFYFFQHIYLIMKIWSFEASTDPIWRSRQIHSFG